MTRSESLRDAAPSWQPALTHPFVRGLGDGTLDEAAFRFYIRQDYLYLIDYGRLLALGAARAPRLSWMRSYAGLAHGVLETEMALHREFAARWGVVDLEDEPVAPATSAYCNFLLRTASIGDFAELAAAVLPCMWTYAEIGRALAVEATSDRYREWIDMYASDEFGELADWARSVVDEVDGPGMAAAFETSCAHEVAFWEAAFNAGGAAPARRPGAA